MKLSGEGSHLMVAPLASRSEGGRRQSGTAGVRTSVTVTPRPRVLAGPRQNAIRVLVTLPVTIDLWECASTEVE